MRGGALALGGVAFGASRVIGSAMEQETTGLHLRSVINAPDRDAALAESLKHAADFARRSLATEEEILRVEYEFNSAGMEASISRAATETALKVAKITRGNSEEVAAIVGTTFNNLGGELAGTTEQKLSTIGNILTKTQFKFQIKDFAQLGESMKFGASTAASYNISLAETATTLGQLNSAGLQGSRAGTAFNAVMRNMNKASEELGFELLRNADGSLDLAGTLTELEGTLDGLDIDERASLLQQLFGDEGMRGIIPLLNKLPELKDGLEEIKKAGEGSLLDDEYARFLESSAGQWTMMTKNIAQVGKTVATILLPPINALLGFLVPVASAIGTVIEKSPLLSQVIGVVGAGFIAMGVALGVATTAMWLFNLAAAANPMVWIVAAIIGGVTLIGAAIALLWKNWDTVWTWITDKALWVWDLFKTVFKWSPLGLIMQGWGKAFTWITDKALWVWDLFKTVFKWSPLGIIMQSWGKAFAWLEGKLNVVGKVARFFGFGKDGETGADVSPIPELAETTGANNTATDNRLNVVGKVARFFGFGKDGETGADASPIPGLAETTGANNTVIDNRQDNRAITVNVTSTDPEAAAQAVADQLDQAPIYDTPLADGLAF